MNALSSIVIQLEPKDAMLCVELGRQMHAESRFRDRNFDDQKCFKLYIHAISNPEQFFVRGVKVGKELVGVIAGFVQEDYFGRDTYAGEYLIYAKPEHRGRGFFRLLQEFIAWAKEKGVKEVSIGNNAGITDDGKFGELLDHFGFVRVGGIYVRALDVR